MVHSDRNRRGRNVTVAVMMLLPIIGCVVRIVKCGAYTDVLLTSAILLGLWWFLAEMAGNTLFPKPEEKTDNFRQ